MGARAWEGGAGAGSRFGEMRRPGAGSVTGCVGSADLVQHANLTDGEAEAPGGR